MSLLYVLAIPGSSELGTCFQGTDEAKRSACKGKRSYNSSSLQRKLVKPLDLTSSDTNFEGKVNDSVILATDVPTATQLNIPTKARSRRKMGKRKPLITKDIKCLEKVIEDQPLFHNSKLSLKVRFLPIIYLAV